MDTGSKFHSSTALDIHKITALFVNCCSSRGMELVVWLNAC
ncbi:hypothetical protein [Synechococcus sp. MIT S1220]